MSNLADAIEHHNEGHFRQAGRMYRAILKNDKQNSDAWHLLGAIAHQMGKYDDAADLIKRAIRISPEMALFHHDLGLVFETRGEIEKATKAFERAISIQSDVPETHWNLSLTLLANGKFRRGWKEYEWRFKKTDRRLTYPHVCTLPRWDGASFADKALFVHDEQGLGDTLQFVRYLPWVKSMGGTVIFETVKTLVQSPEGFPGDRQTG